MGLGLKKHFTSLKKPGLIIEECMWKMMVATKEHVCCLGEEGNQCRVKKRGEVRMQGNFETVISLVITQ